MTTRYEKAPARTGVREIVLAIVTSMMVFTVLAAALFIIDINNPKQLFHNEMSGVLLSAASVPAAGVPAAGAPAAVYTLPQADEEPAAALKAPGEFEGSVLNILLLGLDASPERYETMGSFRTDTIMLLAINFDTNRVDIISVPRDCYAEVPVPESMRQIYNEEIRKTKINEAFTIGGGFKGEGFDNTVRAVSSLLGNLRIDYYAAFDMTVVKDVIDAMGGLYYDVDINVTINGRYVHKGYQLLNGQQVLDYSRVRKGYGDDYMRMDRQQRIVLEAVKQLKESGRITDIPEYYKALSDNIYTDLSMKQIAALAVFANSLDIENCVERHTLPTVPLNTASRSMLEVVEDEKVLLLADIYGLPKPAPEN